MEVRFEQTVADRNAAAEQDAGRVRGQLQAQLVQAEATAERECRLMLQRGDSARKGHRHLRLRRGRGRARRRRRQRALPRRRRARVDARAAADRAGPSPLAYSARAHPRGLHKRR